MKSIREFVKRLSLLVEHSELRQSMSANNFRIVVPEVGQFTLEDSIVRTISEEPASVLEHPGAPNQVIQILQWFDVDDNSSQAFVANDLGVDIAAILALATGRRVMFANEIALRYEGADWTAFLEVGPTVDGEIFGPAEPMHQARFINIVRAIVGLSETRALALGAAIRMRNAGCCLIEQDHSSAYGLLVVALETLSREFGIPPTSWKEWDQAKSWDQFLVRIALSDEQSVQMRDRLTADRQIRLKRTVIEYALRNLTPEFWDHPYFSYTPNVVVGPEGLGRTGVERDLSTPMSDLVPNDPTELHRRLSKSYDTRSQVFHTSTRLNQVALMKISRGPQEPLPFAGLRRVIDFLLWAEIAKAVESAPPLPDFQVVKQPTG